MNHRLMAVGLVAVVAVIIFYLTQSSTMDDPSKAPPREIQISLGETVREFMQTNNLPIESGRTDTPDTNNYAVAVDVIADTDPIIFGDHWIHLAFKVGSQRIDLPPGRTLFIDQEAGRIKSFSFTPYEKAHPLNDTNRRVKQLLDAFLAKGWTPKVANSLTFALTDEDQDFERSGEKIYGQLEDRDGNLLNVTVTNLASVPSQLPYILAPALPRPTHNPPIYVIRLGFYWVHRNESSYGDLVYPRRIFVNGSKDQILRLRAWVEDPDWTPEKHGMVDQGGSGESRRWSSPRK